MTEAELAEYFQTHLGHERLYVQATFTDRHLAVIFNRTADLDLDYGQQKKDVIAHVKKLRLKQLEEIKLCGRIWGEHELEWETTLKVKSKAKSSAPTGQKTVNPKSKTTQQSQPGQAHKTVGDRPDPSQSANATTAKPQLTNKIKPEAKPAEAIATTQVEDQAEEQAVISTPNKYAEFNLVAPDLDDEVLGNVSDDASNESIKSINRESAAAQETTSDHAAAELASDNFVSEDIDAELKLENLAPTSQQETSQQEANDLELATNSEPQTEKAQLESASTADSDIKPGDLSAFCFSRNKHLVKIDLANPDPEVADAVTYFHNLLEADKVLLAPVLNDFFTDPNRAETSHLLPEWQEWLAKLKKLGNREFRSASVWLSRYCLDRTRTMQQVNATLGFKAKKNPGDLDPDDLDNLISSVNDVSIGNQASSNFSSDADAGEAYQKQSLAEIKYRPRSRPTTDLSAGNSRTNSSNRRQNSRSSGRQVASSNSIDIWAIFTFLRRWRIVVSMLIFIFIIVPFRYGVGRDPVTAPQVVNNGILTESKVSRLQLAAGQGNLDQVKELIADGVEVSATDVHGNTALHWAVAGCSAYEYSSKYDEQYYDPICTVQTQHPTIVAFLIDNGANPNGGNIEQETPLHWAAEFGSNETMLVLINKGANVNAKTLHGTTPLDHATVSEDPLRIKLMTDRGGVSSFESQD
ncbi:Ankyrin [Thalassoporum mexicanum PCC 7367]|uniref:ankyrin repeat domain-containing protein n=1 Tax=Thalassoporum mexicanum TaxID=3457544 RepID=UPI00029FC3EE|nr:ankyrin repeat domain-containing protein [Pseudanabaena sp. PCC 7367]AFY68694.1 Ankyrin [Pseudanabaena sp. PCC 7367]